MKNSGVPEGRARPAVAAGALAGTELRYGPWVSPSPTQQEPFPGPPCSSTFPGASSSPALTTFWIARPRTAFWLRAGVGPGLLGSFTTFSAVVFSIDQLARAGPHARCLDRLPAPVPAPGAWRGGRRLADRQSACRPVGSFA